MKIAVLGGKREQAEVMSVSLNGIGHECSTYEHGNLFLESGRAADYDLFVVELSAQADSMDYSFIARVRAAAGRAQPVLLLTDCTNGGAEAALVAGADGYMSKPLRAGEMAARVNALLRRAYPQSALPSERIKIGDYQMDSVDRTVTLRGNTLRLSRREFDLSLYLFRNLGRLVPRIALEKAIWGRLLEFDSKTLDTHVYRLRVKLQLQPENGLQLNSVYARGFRLTPVMAMTANQTACA